MAGPITWVLRLEADDGQQEAFDAVMQDMVASTEEESGALVDDWFVDGATVHILERYSRADAVLTHMERFGQNFADRFLGSIMPVELAVHGDPSDAVREVLAGLAPDHDAPLASIGN